MTDQTYKQLAVNGLWNNNPALVQVLGLCPLLAVSGTVVNAMGLGLATLLVLVCSNLAVSLIRHWISPAIRLPAFVMIIAAFVTCAELLMQAFAYPLYQVLGIFIPLIVTNCAILGRAEAFASRVGPLPAAWDGLMMGLGFLAVLVLLGGIRELVGQGTLFSQMHLLLGEAARDWGWKPFSDYPPVLIMILPPGAFLGLGLLIAAKNAIDLRRQSRLKPAEAKTAAGQHRVRVTGVIR